jgi:biopolymer transport protein ExbD
MADIAFLLLVFFLVTTQFLEDKGLGLVLAEKTDKESIVPKKNMMHLIVHGDEHIAMRYRDVESRLSVSDVRAVVQSSLHENANLIVNLKTAPDAPYKAMISVLDELRRADARRISLGQLKEPIR